MGVLSVAAISGSDTSVRRPAVGGGPWSSPQFWLDAAVWVIAIISAQALRNEFSLDQLSWPASFELAFGVVVAQGLLGWTTRLYRGRYLHGSFEEARALAATTFVSATVAALPVILVGPWLGVPRSTLVIALPLALLIMFAGRYLVRSLGESRVRPDAAERAIVYGAGCVGENLIRRLLTDPVSPYLPVAILDDDPRRGNARIRGIDVVGTLTDLAQAAHATQARVLIVAIANADPALMRKVTEIARPLQIQVKIVPPLDQILNGRQPMAALRDISIEDLVGRQPVDTDVESIAGYLKGKRVLVTGAGGSIGVELCKQIHRFEPAELIMLDRDETGLQNAQLNVFGNGLLDGPEVVLADIRDVAALSRIFGERRPEVVFHAAALKHLPMLQQYPEEAWKTNVIGTQNVLVAAQAVGVGVFVNISTDKAANPVSVLGHSKRLAERLTARMGRRTGLPYLSVRFGNVLGSRGSMVPLFQAMIERGGPLTVTHPDVTRYFMTIPEACQLVVQAGGIGEPGEVLILDMGEPVRILDVANRMIEMSGRRVEIAFTGLRAGEKLHEVLLSQGEVDERPLHRRISHAQVPPLRPDELDRDRWLAEWSQTASEPPGEVVRELVASAVA